MDNLPPTNPTHEQFLQNLQLLKQNFNSFVQSEQFIRWNETVALDLLIKENWSKLTTKQFIELYDNFIQWLKKLETLNLQEKNYEIHHIVPKFANGSNDVSNLVECSPVNHSLAHTLRFLFSENRGDLFGATSAGIVKEKLSQHLQGQKMQEVYDRTTRNPEWQKTHGAKGLANRKKPVMRERQRAAVSAAAKETQVVNSKRRVNPITWFLSSQNLIWTNNTKGNQEFQTLGSSDFFQANASNIARTLISYIPNANLEKSPYLISSVLVGENLSRYGWGLSKVCFQSGNYEPKLIREAIKYALDNKFTNSNLNEFQKHFASLPIDVCQKILNFCDFYQKFLAEKSNS